MKSISLAMLLLAAAAVSSQSQAGIDPKAESLKLVAYYDIGAERYREFEVSCSNRTEVFVYKREQKREWCVGGPGTGECFRDNIGASQRACADSTNNGLAKQ